MGLHLAKQPYHQGAAKQKMWQSMRILRTFTASDVAQTSEVSVSYARAFMATLRRAGYLKRQAGDTSIFAMHQLIRNTGPHAPRHWSRNKQVFDVNRGETYDLA